MPDRYRERPYVPAKDPLSAIPPSRHPFQFWVLFALFVSGAANFFTPGSVVLREGLDPFFHKLWAVTLMISTLLGLISAFLSDRISGLLVERIALLTMGLSCPAYAIVVGIQMGVQFAFVSIVIMFSIGIAGVWRAVHVSRELRILRHFVTRHF